ncbi:coiled-coil domain-containing protein 115 isoform X3 [Pristis pectinata]|uniref:coiled-coil domain-containing protein 115 isoform X3 n=1 Tax=Pristis pectinata TaxID=685728 RepID=UPI00223E6B9E|nr:coiled-coil domain-containing protein 115 isoform X3 [Pristis pectinata]
MMKRGEEAARLLVQSQPGGGEIGGEESYWCSRPSITEEAPVIGQTGGKLACDWCEEPSVTSRRRGGRPALSEAAAMGSEAGPESLCERLDEQLLRYLEEMEQLNDRRDQLERLMEQGWFLLSKARYSMGNKRVSALQYGPEMVPLARVDVSQEDDGHYSFRVERVDSGDVQTVGAVVDESLEMEEIGPKEWEGSPLVRRRRPRGSGEEGQKAPPADGLVGGSRASTKDGRRVAQQGATLPAQEPLNWFGILVPQSLRLAQASFKED